jgi:hypothetical protein
MALPDLTTLANFKANQGITGTVDDAELSRLITAASAFVRSYCGRDFSSQSYSQVWSGKGAVQMPFRQYPVTAVASLTIDGVTVPPSDGVTPGYVFDDHFLMLMGYRFTRGFNNVQVSYTAGFDPIPYDLEQVVIELVGLRRSQAQTKGKSSQGMANETTTFIVKDMLPSSQTAIELYKRRIPL